MSSGILYGVGKATGDRTGAGFKSRSPAPKVNAYGYFDDVSTGFQLAADCSVFDTASAESFDAMI